MTRRPEISCLSKEAPKAGFTVGRDDFSGLRHLAQRLGDDFIVGLVMYTGQQTLSFGPRLRAPRVRAARSYGDLGAVSAS
jgi:hypothetical protein